MHITRPSEVTLQNLEQRISNTIGFGKGAIVVRLHDKQVHIHVVPPADLTDEGKVDCNSYIRKVLAEFGFTEENSFVFFPN